MATKINLRSPYYIKVSKTALTSVELKLYIYTGTFTANGSVAAGTLRYTINKKPLGSNAYVVFEVSELVRDYLEVEFNGDYNSESVWLNAIATVTGGSGSETVSPDNTNGFIGLDGYGYFEEGANPTLSTTALQTNKTIIALDDNLFRVPVFVPGTESVSLLYKKPFLITTFKGESEILVVNHTQFDGTGTLLLLSCAKEKDSSVLKFQPLVCIDTELSSKICFAIETSDPISVVIEDTGASPIILSIVLIACSSLVVVICVAIYLFKILIVWKASCLC